MKTTNQKLAWAILVICLLSIPINMLVPHAEKTQNIQDSNHSDWFMSVRDRIQVIKISGPIMDHEGDPFTSHSGSAAAARKELRKVIKNDHVKAVLLRINSPGGAVACSQEVYDAVMAVKEAHKPIIVSMGDVAASGGYYIASAADKIFAEPGTLTGSIGVIINLVNLQGIEQKLGIRPETMKTGPFKDMGSPNRPISLAERKVIESILFDSYDQFVGAIVRGRKMKREDVIKLADGRVYSGRQAIKAGLIDQLGGYDDALAYLQKTCKEKYDLKKDLPVEEEKTWDFLTDLLESSSSSRINPLGILNNVLPASMNSRFYKQPLWIMQ